MATDNENILTALKEGAFALEGQFVYGSNYTFMVDCTYQEQTFRAVYKPARGERPLWDFPHQTLSQREVAAFLVSEALGWGLVPPTVYREKETPIGPGSAQLFIEHNPDKHFFNFNENERQHLPEVMAFDLLVNNADRKAGHLLIDPAGKVWLIDHGLCFHAEDKLRTVIWDLAGDPLPENLLTDVAGLLPQLEPHSGLTQELRPLLLPEEIEALRHRAEQMLTEGRFPMPPEDRRAYPWPLV